MRKLILSIVTLLIILTSCKDSSVSLQNVTGKSGEVVLVIDPDQWSSGVGTEFRELLSQEIPVMPQPEPMFDLVHIPYDAFSNIFKTHRNLIFAKIDKSLREPKIVVQKDVWAKPQIVINVIAPNDSTMERVLKEKGDVLVDRLFYKEMERYIANYKKYAQPEIADRLEQKFGIRLTIPKGYTLDVDTTDFVWMESRGLGDVVQGVLVFTYDKPEVELTSDYLFAKSDQFTKRFVPGPNVNSYVAVEREMNPIRKEMIINGLNITELRGLWKVENDFMGGPFVSFTYVDQDRDKIIYIMGFVYAPQFDKRDYLRQVEAILNTVEKPKDESTH